MGIIPAMRTLLIILVVLLILGAFGGFTMRGRGGRGL